MMPGPAKKSVSASPFVSGEEKLSYLRKHPKTACQAYGFICRGALLSHTKVGGNCKLRCYKDLGGVFRIEVEDGAGDWYIPFMHDTALYCDVPKGQPDGTMVVTFPMNGCALEVVEQHKSNRFYHDSDGKHMPAGDRTAKLRIEYEAYSGKDREAENYLIKNSLAKDKNMRNLEPDLHAEIPSSGCDNLGSNLEHTLICIKNGNVWTVFQTVVNATTFWRKGDKNDRGKIEYAHIKQRVPIVIGVFQD